MRPSNIAWLRSLPGTRLPLVGPSMVFAIACVLSIPLHAQSPWQGFLATPHGLTSSLAAHEGRVFVWIERKESPYVLAIDPATGQNLWKIDRKGSTAWSSPIVAEMPSGESHLVLSAAGSLVGYDLSDGRE